MQYARYTKIKFLHSNGTRFFQFELKFLPQFNYFISSSTKLSKFYKIFKFKEFSYKKNKKFQLKLKFFIFFRFSRVKQKILMKEDRFLGFFVSLIKSDSYYFLKKNNIYWQVKYLDYQFKINEFYFFTNVKLILLQYILFLKFKISSLFFSYNIQYNYLRRQRLTLLQKQKVGDTLREIQVQYYNIFIFSCIILSFFFFNNDEMLGKILRCLIPAVYYYIIIFDMEDNQELQYNLKFYI